jgi:ribosomal RNA-processing protein 36
MHKTELSTLKENLKRAKKMLASSPHNQREEREEEVARLEQAIKRAESNVNKDKREQVEQDALQKAKQEEKEKRKVGKGAWHMKDCKAGCSWLSCGR